jgi:hypothetical protein
MQGGYQPQQQQQPANSQFGGAVPQQMGPGAGPGNPALGMIQNILSQPRPGGMPGQQQTGGVMGPGIIGVATKYEGVGIKVYEERSKYQEWEFIYDPKKEKAPNTSGNIQGGMGGGQPGQQGQQGQAGGLGPTSPGIGGGPGGGFGGGPRRQ